MHQWLSGGQLLQRYVKALFVGLGILWAVLLFALPFAAGHVELLLPYLRDPFAAACLQTPVTWDICGQVIAVFICDSRIGSSLPIIQNCFRASMLLWNIPALVVGVILCCVAPKIEQYTQAPMMFL